jgi:hypothetical protein
MTDDLYLIALAAALAGEEAEEDEERRRRQIPVQYWGGTQVETPPQEEDFMQTTVTLTHDQIKALPSTAFDVVPAPGAGKMNQFILGIIEVDTAAGAYTNVNAAAQIQFQLAPTGNATPITTGVPLDGTLDVAGTALNSVLQDTTNTGFGNAFLADIGISFDNLSIGVWIGNGGAGPFEDGHASNSMKITVIYQIIDL